MGKILIIDDDKATCESMTALFEHWKHEISSALTLKDGLAAVMSEEFDVVFLDVNLPDGNGLEALPDITASRSQPEAIIITGAGAADGAELAIKSGAWDYIEKGTSIGNMMLSLDRCLQYRKEKAAGKGPMVLKRDEIIGNSQKIMACLNMVAQAASSDTNVLVTGETGTGKELFARAIHYNSARADRPFVVVDCAALPENLVEAVLFGHEKGAFTGAVKAQEGLVKEADGGTLLLDEVGELPLAIQKTFLRVLQERTFRPVGSKREVKSDFRLVSATNRNLDEISDKGGFRTDLLFRLRSLMIEVPPLREHPEDIRDLAIHYVGKFCERYGLEIKGFSPEFFDALVSYNWPGNTRELINALDSAVTVAGDDPTLFSKDLAMPIRVWTARAAIGDHGEEKGKPGLSGDFPSFKELKESVEKEYLQKLSRIAGNDVKKACLISGLSRSGFYKIMKKHHLSIAQS